MGMKELVDVVAWPTAEISGIGPEGGTNIILRKEVAAAANADEERARRVEGDAAGGDPGAGDGAHQEGRASMEEARRDTGVGGRAPRAPEARGLR